MRLDDHTSVFDVDKRFYRLGDIQIPAPLSYRAAAWGGAAFVVSLALYWTVLSKVVGLLPLPGIIGGLIVPALLILGPTVAMGLAASNTLKHDKRLGELLLSRANYTFQPKRVAAMQSWNEPEQYTVTAEPVINCR